MAEYIEKQIAEERLCNLFQLQAETAKAIIDAIPSADVVPVVRCKDCKHNLANIPDIQDGININEDWDACQLTELYDSVEPLDFCSRGAKMDGGET